MRLGWLWFGGWCEHTGRALYGLNKKRKNEPKLVKRLAAKIVKNRHLLSFLVQRGKGGKVAFGRMTGKLPKLFDEMRLVVVAALVSQLGQRVVGRVTGKGRFKANNAGKELWHKAGKGVESAFKLLLR